MDNKINKRTLYIVPTPIGNLSDLSYRAANILQSVDLILCEDQRVSKRLLSEIGSNVRCMSIHKFNEVKQLDLVLKLLLDQEQAIALISDAGTPGICDPGAILIQECHAKGVDVISIPGPCALVTALSKFGNITNEFIFVGFLPVKTIEKRKCLYRNISLSKTLVCYEAPHRLIKTLEILAEILLEQPIFLCKELSKVHETSYYATSHEILKILNSNNTLVKGEWIIIIPKQEDVELYTHDQILDLFGNLTKLVNNKDLVNTFAELGIKKSELKRLL